MWRSDSPAGTRRCRAGRCRACLPRHSQGSTWELFVGLAGGLACASFGAGLLGGYRPRRKTRLRAYGESAGGILGAILDGADSERAEPLRAWKSETSR
jgi:hypothetical protein